MPHSPTRNQARYEFSRLVRVDKLKPWEELSAILLMIDQHRAELVDLKKMAKENRDGSLTLRCLRELTAMEEKRLRILQKVGLFTGYRPERDPLSRLLDDTDRTKVEDDDDELVDS